MLGRSEQKQSFDLYHTDRVDQRRELTDRDLHLVAGRQGEVIRWDDAGTCQQHGPVGKRQAAAQILNQLVGPAADSSLVKQRGDRDQFLIGLSATYRFDFTLP